MRVLLSCRLFELLCRSTTKVLCKWDLESSKLIPVETDIMTERPCGDILQLDNSERSVGPDISSEDFREAESASSAVPIPFPESSEHFFSPENEDFLKSDGKALKPSKSLDTVADVENAIRYEKKVAMLRYQASMRKVRSLEVLLNTLKKNGNTSPDSSTSCSSPVDRDTPSTAQMSVPCGQNVPSTKNLHTSPPQLCRLPNLLSPLIGITSLGDSDLPPPLFDDYN